MVGFQKLSVLFVAALAAIVEAGPKDKPKPTPPPGPLKLAVKTKGGGRNKTAPLLHGLFFEDINVSLFSIARWVKV